uniref:Scaffolding anchor of CK1 domain-containing protein n=1 Tax=Hucho hucho TaxID=62062 RepID=A0A4W5L7K2_9TELE
MAHRSQSSDFRDNPLDPNFLPPHYREEYRLAIDALVETDLQGYYEFLQTADVVDFLCQPEIEHIKTTIQTPNQAQTSNVPELSYHQVLLIMIILLLK